MYAGGWLLPVDGTSFASPLAARYASINAPSPFAVATARQAVLSATDANGELPASDFPADLFYTPAEISTDAVVARASRTTRRRVDPADLHRILLPIRLFRALRGG
jgi:hypothetical protein